jgi:D-alanine-D-alanine ligase
VSLASGAKVVDALRQGGHRVLLLDPYKSIESQSSFEGLYEAYAKDNFAHAIPAREPDLAALKAEFGNGDALLGKHVLAACALADVVFLALHGSYGENGQLQATLDLHGIRYTGSGYVGCMLSMDKGVAKVLMQAAGVQTPPMATAEDNLPLVIKPISGGSSFGVTIAHTREEVDKALEHAGVYDSRVMVEPYIAGREFSVGVLDGKALPVIEICPKEGWFDYVNKYQDGATEEICPADIPAELALRMQEMALKAHRALQLGSYSRADFIVDAQGEIYCLEVNSLPGMSPASLLPKEAAAAGISYEALCEKIIQLAMGRA